MSLRPFAARCRPLLGGWFLLVLFLQAACVTGAPRGGRLGQDVTLAPHDGFAPVQVSDLEVREALTQLFLEQPLWVADRATGPLAGRLVFASSSPGDMADFTRLGQRDRFTLALRLSLSPAVQAATGVIQDASATAMTTLLTGLSLYLLVLMAPEPISKGLALTMTLFLWSYLGQEFWGLISATKELWDAAKAARTFPALRDASARYARVLGPNTLRVLLLLAAWKAGARGNEPMTGRGLPGFPQAVRNAATAGGFSLSGAAAEATSVSVVEGRLSLTLPSSAGAVLAMQAPEDGDLHHIATVENEKSPARGGPWTPRLKQFFDKAGMSMEDAANKVRIPGHKGPHPEAYHQTVFKRLEEAVRHCKTTAQCREALTRQLRKLAEQLRKEGSTLNKLITRTEQD